MKVHYSLENAKVKEIVQDYFACGIFGIGIFKKGQEIFRTKRKEIVLTEEKTKKITVGKGETEETGKKTISRIALSKKRILKRKLEKPKNSLINIKDEILLLIGAVVSN